MGEANKHLGMHRCHVGAPRGRAAPWYPSIAKGAKKIQPRNLPTIVLLAKDGSDDSFFSSNIEGVTHPWDDLHGVG